MIFHKHNALNRGRKWTKLKEDFRYNTLGETEKCTSEYPVSSNIKPIFLAQACSLLNLSCEQLNGGAHAMKPPETHNFIKPMAGASHFSFARRMCFILVPLAADNTTIKCVPIPRWICWSLGRRNKEGKRKISARSKLAKPINITDVKELDYTAGWSQPQPGLSPKKCGQQVEGGNSAPVLKFPHAVLGEVLEPSIQ